MMSKLENVIGYRNRIIAHHYIIGYRNRIIAHHTIVETSQVNLHLYRPVQSK
jgi:hypothetical protein